MRIGPIAVATMGVAMVVMAAATTDAGQAASTPARRGGAAPAAANPNKAKLTTPSQLNEKAPDAFKARFDASAGVFVIEVHREWAPLGADRFYNLVKNGFYDDIRFFRVLDQFMAQFGMHGDPKIQSAWGRSNFMDDPVKREQQTRPRDVCRRPPPLPIDAGLHQLRRQRQSRRAGLRSVRSGRRGDG